MDFGRLDGLRGKDENQFERVITCLCSVGLNNITTEMVVEAFQETDRAFETKSVSIDEMRRLFERSLILGLISDIKDIPLETILDYIAEYGWREHDRR